MILANSKAEFGKSYRVKEHMQFSHTFLWQVQLQLGLLLRYVSDAFLMTDTWRDFRAVHQLVLWGWISHCTLNNSWQQATFLSSVSTVTDSKIKTMNM